MNRILLISSCMLLLIGACSREEPKDEYKFIEYLKVEGTCFENHVKESAAYSGSLVHWYNVTKDKHTRYGAVTKSGQSTTQKIIEIKNPYRYYPPFSVSFTDIPPDMFSKTEMKLSGISEHLPKGNAEESTRYEATCELRVIERLDYLPNSQTSN